MREAEELKALINHQQDQDRKKAEEALQYNKKQTLEALELSNEAAKVRNDRQKRLQQEEEDSVEEYQKKTQMRLQEAKESKQKAAANRENIEKVAADRAAVTRQAEEQAV